ncbi:MAG: hypothetical protein Kow0040_21400 [Thermogutta sp.]
MTALIGAERQNLVDWSRRIVSTLGDKADATVVQAIEQAEAALWADRFCLAVMGKAKRGKSTLINAILGRTDDLVAPVDKLPASSAISRIRWAERENAVVVFRDGRREPISFSRIREYVTEEYNPENRKGVDVVEIEGPFSGLESGFELVDTPGAGSIHEHHDALLYAFIPQADAVIILVTARMPLDQDELDLLKKVKENDIRKIFFAINRVDECTEKEIEEGVAHNMQLLAQLGIHVDQIYRISAKRAFQGDLAGSGLTQLTEDIGRFIRANKGRFLAARFVARVCNVVQPIANAIDLKLANSRKSQAEIDAELADLRQRKLAIESTRQRMEREFENSWALALEEYQVGLNQAELKCIAAVAERIAQTSVFKVSSLAKEMTTFVNDTLEQHLLPVSSRFEQRVREAADRLQTNYPELVVGEQVRVGVVPQTERGPLLAAAGGTAAAAAGVGFAMAGASTAASIAAANAAVAAGLSGAVSVASAFGFGTIAQGLASAALPTLLTTTPLWVAISGPVGWTLAGVGALAISFSWRASKMKLKEELDRASREQIAKVFQHIRNDRIPLLRRMGANVVEDLRNRFDRQLAELESVLVGSLERRPDPAELETLAHTATGLQGLLRQGADFCAEQGASQ